MERPAARGMGDAYKEDNQLKLPGPVRVSSETQEENHGTDREANSYDHRRSLLGS